MRRTIHARVVLLTVSVALLAGGCGAGAAVSTPSALSPVATAAVLTAAPTAALDSTVWPMPTFDGDVSLQAGTYVFNFTRLDAPGKPFPKVLITVPDGWSGFRGFGVDTLTGPRYHFVSFWNVVDVYANSCHWLGPRIHSGSTVEELVAALVRQPSRNATRPVAVTLGGYTGKYLEWSVPTDIDFSSCDRGAGDTTGNFESWTGDGLWDAPWDPSGETDRYEQGPGQVDRLWIFDVEGRRLVIDASYMPGATAQDKADVQQVVDTIRFEP